MPKTSPEESKESKEPKEIKEPKPKADELPTVVEQGILESLKRKSQIR